jgi:hypothetical protein
VLPATLTIASLWWLSRYSLTPDEVADAVTAAARTEEPT